MNKSIKRNLLSGGICAFAVMSFGSSAFAQDNASTQDGQAERGNIFKNEIVVTARKNEENLQDVPIAVSAFSGEQLEALGVIGSGDVAALVPNLTWNTEFGRASPQVYLRGVGSNNFAPTNAGPVAIYQDGVVIGPNIVQGFAAFDLARVEVLKGPQGTLFGRNSTGGLVNFISTRPEIGGGADGYVSAEVGDFGTFNFKGAATLQVSENVAARVAFISNNSGGEYTNVNPGASSDDAGGTSDYSGRLQVLYDNQSDFSLLLNVHGSFANPDVTPQVVGGTFGPASCATNVVFGTCQSAFGFATPGLKTTAKQDDQEEVENIGGFVELKYDFGDVALTWLTGYDESSLRRLDDVDESPASDEFDHYVQDFDTFSTEVRLSSQSDLIDWHVGGYYYKQNSAGLLVFDFPTDDSVFGPGTGFGVGNLTAIKTESFAGFAQGVWKIGDSFRITTGMRYTTEKIDVPVYIGFTNVTDPGQNTLYKNASEINIAGGITEFDISTDIDPATGKLYDRTERFNRLTGQFSLDYRVSDSTLIYASYSRGFKGGDVNGVAVGTIGATAIARPETVDSYEIGFKGDFSDIDLKVNAAAFYLNYTDQQQAVILAGSTAAGEPQLTNTKGATIPGFELDFVWTPSSNFTLLGALGYIDATFGEFNTTDGDLTGNRVPLVSEVQASLVAKYDVFLANDGTLSMQVDGSYQSSQFFTPQNDLFPEVAALREDGYALANASITYTAPDDAWSIKGFVRNLADKEYLVSGFGIPGFISSAKPGVGRYFGGALTVNFN